MIDIKNTYYTEQHWDGVASVRVFDSTACSRALINTLRGRSGELAGRRVLDVGTGGGTLVIDLVRHGAEAVGIDVSSVGIEAASRNADAVLGVGEERARLRFLKMDAHSLEFASASFDVVTFLKAIWVLPDAPACLAECHRVLAPGGRMVIQLWGDMEESELLVVGSESVRKFVPSLEMPDGARSVFRYTPEYVEQLLADAGFSGFECTTYQARFEFSHADAFWELFRSVAGTAYYAYASQPAEVKKAISAAWEERSRLFRNDSGNVVLPLEWSIATAVKA
ncbi:class I SAM-dependent methyltransferase [Corallococcus exercitus]|uniref:Class I SAM-dependent methyltransferase n=1 Tax=Corallococcus exercitus TaxID=2316736 RepID=A0A3A8IXF9_9BACT|nr:class I SAM-dependent methyltransferase [Corallococcus exercitus]NOK33332.1 class I SAM-dependent methyltransferase [Corallococcus exercitus]RKG82981.1 class I SAM-dependent methyltransferase [Corallococcus exercitus]